MINIQITDYSVLIAFWLAFTRLITIMFQVPLFDNVSIPVMVKVLATLVITYALFPYISPQILLDINYVGVESFWILTIFNAVIGLLIGFILRAIMMIFISAGSIMTQQMGFAALRYFDPTAGAQIGPYEKLIQWTILILILTSGALLPMFKGIFSTFFSIHIYDIGKIAHSPEFFFRFFKSVFSSALMLASPLVFTNVLVMSILGIIARTVPQMNVLMISFVVNIGMGLLVFFATADEFFHVAYKLYTEKLGDWFQFIG